MARRVALLVNIGSPAKPSLFSVARFLFAFLNDKRVIDLPYIPRVLLVNLIIVPFRIKKSTSLYKRLWKNQESPLIQYSNKLIAKIREISGDELKVLYASRYGQPHIIDVLKRVKESAAGEIIIVPLFPHYASSTTGSVIEKCLKEIKNWKIIPRLRIVNQFYHHPAFIDSFSTQINRYKPPEYDHVIFSYHGLPLKHVDESHPGISSQGCNCESRMPSHGRACYKAACYATTRLLVNKLGLSGNFSVGFQSRFTNNWLSPFTDELIMKLAKQGVKKLLVVAPSFVTDCLETIVEIEEEYNTLFLAKGGEKLTLVKSLNDEDHWAKNLLSIIS